MLAPEGAGAFLIGGGPSAPSALLDWGAAELAPLHEDGGALPPGLRDRLAAFEAAVVYSRNQTLLAHLRTSIPTVVHRDPAPPAGAGHASWWLAGAIRDLGLDVPQELPLLEAAAGATPDGLPDGFLAVHPGSGTPRKNWPAERFAALAEALGPAAPFALIEGPADSDAAARLATLAPRARIVRNAAPHALAGLLARAGCYLGNDSGVSHLAAALGVPTIALFGPSDPAVWAPIGPHVATLRAPGGDLARLEVTAVLDYVSGAWTSRRLISR